MPLPLPDRAVGSYPTFSPSPRRRIGRFISGRSAGGAVCFLWHFPWGRPRRQLTGTVFPWSPDFPPRTKRSGHPTDWQCA